MPPGRPPQVSAEQHPRLRRRRAYRLRCRPFCWRLPTLLALRRARFTAGEASAATFDARGQITHHHGAHEAFTGGVLLEVAQGLEAPLHLGVELKGLLAGPRSLLEQPAPLEHLGLLGLRPRA